MRILITGGAGFLGSHLTDRFLAEGHEVLVLDNLITGSLDNVSHHFGHPHFMFIKHDVTTHIHALAPSTPCFISPHQPAPKIFRPSPSPSLR